MTIDITKPVQTKSGHEPGELAWVGGFIVGTLYGTLTVWHESGSVLATWPFSTVSLTAGDDLVNV